MLKTHTLFCAGAFALASAAQAAEKFPDFSSKVQLHNFDGYELTPDGSGVSVYRLPSEVREHLSVVCISILPFGADKAKKTAVRPQEFRKTLEEICRATPHKNVHFVDGTQLLSFTGLSADLLHPSDHGMIEIFTKLVPRIREWMSIKN